MPTPPTPQTEPQQPQPFAEDVPVDDTPAEERAWQIAGTNAQRARVGLPPLPDTPPSR